MTRESQETNSENFTSDTASRKKLLISEKAIRVNLGGMIFLENLAKMVEEAVEERMEMLVQAVEERMENLHWRC